MDESHIYLRRLMKEEREAKSAAEEVMDKAMLDGRDMTEEEHAEVKTLHEAWTKAKEALTRAQDDMKLRKMFERPEDPTQNDLDITFGGKQVPGITPAGKSMGEQWVASGVWRGMKDAKGNDRLPASFKSAPVNIELKAASSPLLESNATSTFGNGTTAGPVTTMLPGVETPSLVQLPPTIADLLNVIPIREGNSATYRVLKARTFPAYPANLPIGENVTKPTAAYEFDVVTVALTKLAAITKISEEWLEDDAATIAFINMDMPAQLRIVEEAYLAGVLYNAVTDASLLSGGVKGWDSLASAAEVIQAAGFNPNAFIITPADWWKLVVSKYGTGAGDKEYVGGGPFGSTGNPFNLRPVISASATAGHPLVGDFNRGAYIQRKGGLRMDSTNSDGTDFDNNLVTLRVEMREAVKKVYPEAFKTADIS